MQRLSDHGTAMIVTETNLKKCPWTGCHDIFNHIIDLLRWDMLHDIGAKSILDLNWNKFRKIGFHEGKLYPRIQTVISKINQRHREIGKLVNPVSSPARPTAEVPYRSFRFHDL